MPAVLQQPTLPHYAEDDFSIDPKDWIPAMVLLADLEKEMAEKRTHLLRRLSTWYSLITIFRRLEREKMVARQPSVRDTKYHRTLLDFLIGSGSVLVMELEVHKQIDSKSIGIPFESVAAQLEELRDDHRMWHGGMKDERRKEILSDVFGI